MRPILIAVALLALTHPTRADKLVLVAGGGELGDGHDATKAKLIQPFGVDFQTDGTVVIVEMAKGERLRVVTHPGKLLTLAGTMGVKGNDGDGAPAIQGKATFNGMHSLAVGPEGNVYLADTWNNRVRVFESKSGLVRAFAGTGEKGFSGDGGPAEKARFGGVYCVAFDPDRKNLFITDLDNRRIRKVDMAAKIVTTVAGNGERACRKTVSLQRNNRSSIRAPRARTRTGTCGSWNAAVTHCEWWTRRA